MDKNTFFSAKNTDLIYTICRDEVMKKTQYNIDSNKKYYKVFGEIMKIVHKHAASPNDLGELNNRTIGKTIPYLVNEIEKPFIPEFKSSPSRAIICITITLIGGVFSLIFALIRHFMRKSKLINN